MTKPPTKPATLASCRDLDEVRAHIDRLDAEIVALMAERSGYVGEAARFKPSREGVVDRARIEDIITSMRSRAQELGLEPDIAEAVFRRMIDAFIKFEKDEFDRLHEGD
ncbi:MAG: chorismate mutase [Alphaproteobacteria bacterium]|jgi:isochorismate pyruvate lyase|nr:chorismate mutase [Alphaproteobacteria bacterium]MDP7123592.1 chorismate mutase [Alphaproteobacteria bacterium]MDP7311004.1 chorismate mutase [Alphaproteobacteria bacterium]MDP7543814.1 chorismate mutase [Alphaproteobacteria bacterium]MEE1568884.1 chorismate mutase [Alphaproteobacteria bacterium]